MIAAVILTRNEESNIKNSLNSVLWCDEVVVIDDNSTDKTLQIIKEFHSQKIKIFQRGIQEDFASQRNYALEKVKSDWVFFVDADEIVSSALQFEIINTINSNLEKKKGYLLRRKDFMWGKAINHGESNNTKLLRLGRKDSGEWVGKVHEEWKIQGPIGELQHVLIHYPHSTVKEFLEEINHYTNIRAIELYTLNKKANVLSLVFYPTAKFIQNYIFRRGFLDGTAGLILSLIMSFHSFLVRGKLWMLWQQTKKINE